MGVKDVKRYHLFQVVNSHLNRITDWALMAGKAKYRAKELAEVSHVSLRQLERFFHEFFNRTPQDWLDELRLVKATLLLTGGASVKETAWQLGFRGVPHFSRRFKDYHGCSPSEFIRIHDRRKVERQRRLQSWFPDETIPELWLQDPALLRPWEVLLQPLRYRLTAKNSVQALPRS